MIIGVNSDCTKMVDIVFYEKVPRITIFQTISECGFFILLL